MRAVGRVRRPTWLGGERGVALPTTMILLIVMLGAAGFAIDVGHWYLTANRAQQAADAGALAGVTKLPLDEPGSRTTAFEAAGANGFSSTDVTVEDGNRANQLRVTVERTVDNFFAGLFGVDQTTITRTALAEFQGPSIMGSPNNWLGNSTSLAHVQPEYWLMNAAPGSMPSAGDRFQAGNGSSEYDPNGYTYKLDVKSVPASGDLILQAFDPGQVDVGFTACDRLPTDALNQELVNDHPALYGIGGTYTSPTENARERYERGRWEPNVVVGGVVVGPSDHIYCTADNGSVDVTTFMLRAPDLTPQNDLDNPIITPVPASHVSSGASRDTGGDNIHKYLDPDDGWRDGDHAEFAGQFRQWVTLCSIPNNLVEVGQYILQVRTNSAWGVPSRHRRRRQRDQQVLAPGRIRDGGCRDAGRLQRQHRGHRSACPCSSGAVAANTEFFLTRVPPATNGSFIEVSFWDVGDGAGNGHIQVLPPIEYMNSDGTYGPAGTNVFRDCIWEDTIGTTGGTPSPANDCTLDNVNTTFNGDLVTVVRALADRLRLRGRQQPRLLGQAALPVGLRCRRVRPHRLERGPLRRPHPPGRVAGNPPSGWVPSEFLRNSWAESPSPGRAFLLKQVGRSAESQICNRDTVVNVGRWSSSSPSSSPSSSSWCSVSSSSAGPSPSNSTSGTVLEKGARLAAVNHGHYDESDNERTPSAQTTALVEEICSRMDRDGEAEVTISGGGDVGDETEVTVLRELDTLTGFFDGWLGGREIESTVSMRTEQDATWQVATAADCPAETT